MIAVTGYNGFIGSHLIRELNHRGRYAVGVSPTALGTFSRIYHLACPATTAAIQSNPTNVMDTIMDATRHALEICKTAEFINISSMGASTVDFTKQGAYDIAKRCMEIYVHHAAPDSISYRLPAVYGPGMKDDHFIKRCVDQNAYAPPLEDARAYAIAHIDEVVDALIELRPVTCIYTSVHEIYDKFTSGEWTLDTK